MADAAHVPAAVEPLPPSNMASPGTLNLNNEVVKMRKEVKRIRVLVIRKLVRSVARLKSKKGSEDALLKNQRRAQRLHEEIHAMKELKPDMVTKSALGDDINFEKICKKPDSTATERAIARLAMHPLLKKKIDVLKAAVKAFKDARHNEVKSSKNASEENHSKDTLCSDNASKLQHEGTITREQKEKEAKILAKKPLNNSKEKIVAKIKQGPKAVDMPDSPSNPSVKNSAVPSGHPKITANTKMKTLSQASKKNESDSSLDGNSDEELDEEEKEYFDDSTEERFYKQSSMSEDSDSSGDDFFIGKVRRTRKKESNSQSSVKEPKKHPKLLPEGNILDTHQDCRDDLNRSNTEVKKFESVFFNSLSGTKNSRRNYREQAPKSTTPDFQQNEPQIKNQVSKNAQRGFKNMKQQSQLPLHPSWEASRKRKEQQSKIAVFQGKKITFDD
ncbi:serum response factor-binding protein 1 [Sorex araneus]|uniref:serum response factor-binding protein 1 n=1 Tax=Sorex araneus TaxID=42254 RepID=UPI002433EB25|nr:serum response factor-binding protein 1 [Sorex araneus]